LQRLLATGWDIFVGPEEIPSRGRLVWAARGAVGLLTLLTERIDAEVMDACPDLRVISQMATGVDNVDLEEARRRGIVVCNTPGVLTETCADFTWALMLALSRRLVEGDRMIRGGEFGGWGPLMLLGTDMHGATLGLVGMGKIAQAVARRAAGFGMKVLYWSRSELSRGEEGSSNTAESATSCAGDSAPSEADNSAAAQARASAWSQPERCLALDDLLRRSDVVSLHVPLFEETRHLIDERRLSLMKREAYLINTARGPVVDEAALARALHTGVIAGAALDVFEREPEVHPDLLQAPNTLLAPHTASASLATRERMAGMAVDNLIAVLKGQEPLHRVL
jgi:glyoxylate reductase